jgi:hypothetical protein|tara:strand:- start:16 stop:732 length:717 start_codon:yes stop_codon:yes gene_type:complete
MKKKLLVALVPLVLLSACSSVPKPGDSASMFGNGAKSGDTVRFPDWYYEKPSDDALYSVSSEYSADLQFSVDKAMLSAKRELAGKYSSYVSAMMKDFTAEIGGADDVNRDIERTTKLLIAQVNLVGVKRANFEVRHEGRGFRTFVQLRYSLDDSNRLLIEKVKASKRLELALRKSKSFRELEESVDKINGTEPKAENKPVQPATTDLTAKPVSMKATISDAGSTIDKGIDNTPVKVSN